MTGRVYRTGLFFLLWIWPAVSMAQGAAQGGLTASGLWDQMDRNPAAFEHQYKGKKISFLGEVSSVKRNFARQLVVKLKAGGVRTIDCEFPEMYARSLSTIKPGQRLKVYGHYRNKVVMTMFFERCQVERPAGG